MIIKSLWIGNELPMLNYNCIKSWCKFHPVFLYTYNDIDHVPNGVILKDANEILPESDIFYFNETDIAPFSDLFRYKLLLKGGWWLDADFLMTKSLDNINKEDYVFGSERTLLVGAFKSKQPYKIINGFLKAPENSKLIKKVYELSLEKVKKGLKKRCDLMVILKKQVEKHGLEKYVKPPNVFCNLDWWYTMEAFTEPNVNLWKSKYGWKPQNDYFTNTETVGFHLWGSLIGKKKIDTTKYAYDSLYDLLVRNIHDESNISFNSKEKKKDKETITITF